MSKIDFKKLYEPYSEKATLEETFVWLFRECRALGVSEGTANEAIMAVFTEMYNGREFSTEGAGDRGFDGVPHAELNLCLKDRAIKFHTDLVTVHIKSVEKKTQAGVDAHIKKVKRRAYVEHLKKDSPVLRLFTRKEKDGC